MVNGNDDYLKNNKETNLDAETYKMQCEDEAESETEDETEESDSHSSYLSSSICTKDDHANNMEAQKGNEIENTPSSKISPSNSSSGASEKKNNNETTSDADTSVNQGEYQPEKAESKTEQSDSDNIKNNDKATKKKNFYKVSQNNRTQNNTTSRRDDFWKVNDKLPEFINNDESMKNEINAAINDEVSVPTGENESLKSSCSKSEEKDWGMITDNEANNEKETREREQVRKKEAKKMREEEEKDQKFLEERKRENGEAEQLLDNILGLNAFRTPKNVIYAISTVESAAKSVGSAAKSVVSAVKNVGSSLKGGYDNLGKDKNKDGNDSNIREKNKNHYEIKRVSIKRFDDTENKGYVEKQSSFEVLDEEGETPSDFELI